MARCLNHNYWDDRVCATEFFLCQSQPGSSPTRTRQAEDEWLFMTADQFQSWHHMRTHYGHKFPGGIDRVCGFKENVNTSFLGEAVRRL